jgi:hypothetical protein
MSDKLDQLKEEAAELGIDFNPRIGEEKLQAKIDAHYEAIEKADKEEIVETKTVATVKKIKPKNKPINVIARELYEKAKKTRIVTIVDNDQRVNSKTTTCKASWGNTFYEMPTKIFPLNTPIEIEQGYINSLKEVMIPLHVMDTRTQLHTSVMRPRYSISYEDRQ